MLIKFQDFNNTRNFVSRVKFQIQSPDIISFVWPFAYFGNWDSVLDQIHIKVIVQKLFFVRKKFRFYKKNKNYCCQIYQFLLHY